MSQVYIEVKLYPRAPLTPEERQEVERKLADPEVTEVEELVPYVIHAGLDRKQLEQVKSPKAMVAAVLGELTQQMQEVLETIIPAPW